MQLQRLVQVQLPVAPALQQVAASRLQPVQQGRDLWCDALEVGPARQPAAVSAPAALCRGVAMRRSQAHALEQAPPLSLECVDWRCGNGVAQAAVLVQKSSNEGQEDHSL